MESTQGILRHGSLLDRIDLSASSALCRRGAGDATGGGARDRVLSAD